MIHVFYRKVLSNDDWIGHVVSKNCRYTAPSTLLCVCFRIHVQHVFLCKIGLFITSVFLYSELYDVRSIRHAILDNDIRSVCLEV